MARFRKALTMRCPLAVLGVLVGVGRRADDAVLVLAAAEHGAPFTARGTRST